MKRASFSWANHNLGAVCYRCFDARNVPQAVAHEKKWKVFRWYLKPGRHVSIYIYTLGIDMCIKYALYMYGCVSKFGCMYHFFWVLLGPLCFFFVWQTHLESHFKYSTHLRVFIYKNSLPTNINYYLEPQTTSLNEGCLAISNHFQLVKVWFIIQ